MQKNFLSRRKSRKIVGQSCESCILLAVICQNAAWNWWHLVSVVLQEWRRNLGIPAALAALTLTSLLVCWFPELGCRGREGIGARSDAGAGRIRELCWMQGWARGEGSSCLSVPNLGVNSRIKTFRKQMSSQWNAVSLPAAIPVQFLVGCDRFLCRSLVCLSPRLSVPCWSSPGICQPALAQGRALHPFSESWERLSCPPLLYHRIGKRFRGTTCSPASRKLEVERFSHHQGCPRTQIPFSFPPSFQLCVKSAVPGSIPRKSQIPQLFI